MNTEEDYQPYGPDWETEMMKWNKRHLVDWVRRLLTSQEQDYFESLTDQLKQRDETIKQLKGEKQTMHEAHCRMLDRRDAKIKQLKEALKEILPIANYYHNDQIRYTDMPYKNWNDSMNKARKLLTE